MEVVKQQRKPPMAAMPPKAAPRTNRMSQQQMPAESIYNIKPEAPVVVQYNAD